MYSYMYENNCVFLSQEDNDGTSKPAEGMPMYSEVDASKKVCPH